MHSLYRKELHTYATHNPKRRETCWGNTNPCNEDWKDILWFSRKFILIQDWNTSTQYLATNCTRLHEEQVFRMIKELEEVSKKFLKPTEAEVTQIEINTVTGDFNKESAKFVQEVKTKMQRKKRTNVFIIAVSYWILHYDVFQCSEKSPKKNASVRLRHRSFYYLKKDSWNVQETFEYRTEAMNLPSFICIIVW